MTSNNEKSNLHWWETKTPHLGVYETIGELRQDIDQRNVKLRRHMSAYLNKDVSGWIPGTEVDEDTRWRNALKGEKQLYLNPARSCVQTLAARIAAQKITPTFLTSISDPDAWKLQRQAKQMQKAVQGEWYKGNVYRKAVKVFHDAGIMDLGAMAVYARDGEVVFERVFPGQIIVPETDYLTAEIPRTLYQVAYVSAGVLKARYPDKEEEIMGAIGDFTDEVSAGDGSVARVTDIIEVIEGWHLPSGPKAGDGKHCCVIKGATLYKEKYDRDHYPFAFLRWSEPVLGFYSQGVMESEEPLQMELNKLLRRVQGAMHLFSNAKIIAPKDAKLNPDKIRNVNGDLVEYEGNVKPVVEMPTSINSEVFRFVGQLREWIFESEGVSQMSATSVKPAGIESGRALNTLADLETGRHALLSTSWENFFMDIADLTVEACKDLGDHVSRSRTKNGYSEIKWSEIDLDRTAYELQVFPTSFLPITPTGRLETVERLEKGGFVTSKEEARKLLSFPDLEHSDSLATAAIDDVDRQIEEMLEGEEQSPEPYMVMQQGIIDRVSAAMFRAKSYKYPEDRISLLQDWIDQAQAMQEEEVAKRQMQMEVMQAAEQMPPEGAGGPPAPPQGMPPGMPPDVLPEPVIPQ